MIPAKCSKCGEILTMFHNVSTTLEEATCSGCGAALVSYDYNDSINLDTIRHYYAGLAMQELMSKFYLYELNKESIKTLAKRAVNIADSLIEALQEKKIINLGVCCSW